MMPREGDNSFSVQSECEIFGDVILRKMTEEELRNLCNGASVWIVREVKREKEVMRGSTNGYPWGDNRVYVDVDGELVRQNGGKWTWQPVRPEKTQDVICSELRVTVSPTEIRGEEK